MHTFWLVLTTSKRLFEGKDGFKVEVRVRLGLGLVG